MRFFWAFFLFLLLAPTAFAQDSIKFVIGSKHLYPRPGGGDYNEWNFGLIMEWEDCWGGLDYAVGGFINSFGDFAPYAGISYSEDLGSDWEVAATMGIAYYGDEASDVLSFNGWQPAPWIEVRYDSLWVNFIPVPLEDEFSGIFVYGLEYQADEDLF